jgi:hypothetical protein
MTVFWVTEPSVQWKMALSVNIFLVAFQFPWFIALPPNKLYSSIARRVWGTAPLATIVTNTLYVDAILL